jgi:phenylalanyl-tRNA synthetase beta chain
MKASLRWLRDYAALDAPLDVIVRTLVDTGTEVDAVRDEAERIIVARVIDLKPLPGSGQGLQLATVDVGPEPPRSLLELGIPVNPLHVVSGAPNLRVGDLVPYAPPGTRPPAMDEPIGVRKFRKHVSLGMLCSPAELGLGDDAGGILVLERGTPGQPLREVADLDVVLELEVTPNRPDCLCHIGIARELAAALPGEILREPATSIPDELVSAASAEPRAKIRIDDPNGCPRFAVRVIESVAVRPSPAWLQQRLRAIGVRPINNVVDVTNFVTHELGQPLHAFDLDKFVAAADDAGKAAQVMIRRARDGERLLALNGQEYQLRDDIVVCSGSNVVSLAGIIGGQSTAVDENTRNVLLEAANWDGPTIRATSRRLGLRTDASTIFEKGISDTLPPPALDRAARLIAEHAKGHVLRGVNDEWSRPLPQLGPITITAGFVSDLLGTPVDATEAATVLAHLGFAVEQDAATLVVIPPHFRRDVAIAQDVVEEVGRIFGYARVPSTLPGRRVPATGVAPPAPMDELVRDVCTGAGYDEAITFSFVSASANRALPGLGGPRKPIPLRNPLSEEWSVMRTSQLPGLCAAVATNVNHGVEGVSLFELGRAYWDGERRGLPPGSTPDGADKDSPPLPLEPLLLSVAVHSNDPTGAEATRALRGAHSLFAWLVRDLSGDELTSAPMEETGLRAGRSAALQVGDRRVGLIGEVGAGVLDGFDIRGRLVVGELQLDAVVPEAPRQLRFRTPPRFPAIVQDLAVTVPADRVAAEALRAIRSAGGLLLESVELYDEFRSERLGPGRKGWTFRLTYRAPDRTLTTEEVQRIQENIATVLKAQCDAELRR